jgi:hypothetical protein
MGYPASITNLGNSILLDWFQSNARHFRHLSRKKGTLHGDLCCPMQDGDMSSFDEYRRNAAACLQVAERTADLGARVALLDMAQAWRRLADQAEQNARTDIVYEWNGNAEPVAQQQQQIQADPKKTE